MAITTAIAETAPKIPVRALMREDQFIGLNILLSREAARKCLPDR
jgi:hypothetical protein